MKIPRAHYYAYAIGHVVVVIDEDSGRSVTNDAEWVCEDLYASHGPYTPETRVIYRDTGGIYDELLVDVNGKFMGFRAIDARTLSDALAAVSPRRLSPATETTRG